MEDALEELAQGWGAYADQLDRQRRVLVVDDDSAARILFCAALREDGYEAVPAASAAEARELFTPGAFVAVLADKNLPDTDGLALLRALQEVDRDCEAVVATGYANLETVLAALDLRAADFLTKPLPDVAMLTATFERATRRRHRRMLARRMLRDLKRAVHHRASNRDLDLLQGARQRIDQFRRRIAQKRVVLVAEPEARALHRCLPRLDELGFGVLRAGDPDHVLELCAHARVNVLVLGAKLGSMSGLELCDRLMELASRPEVVFVGEPSGYQLALDALRRGASGFVVKPIPDPHLLLKAIERAWSEQHERLHQFRMVAELHTILQSLAERPDRRRSADQIEPILSQLDVDTARRAVQLLREEE